MLINCNKIRAVFILFALTFLILSLSITPVFAGDKNGIVGEDVLYRDKKNEYFIFAPPEGWTAKEHSDPRTKVAFHSPADYEVYILIIVEEAPGDTFQTIKRRAQETC